MPEQATKQATRVALDPETQWQIRELLALVRTVDGWRIAHRDVSCGNRLDSDPTGGASPRTFSFAGWLK